MPATAFLTLVAATSLAAPKLNVVTTTEDLASIARAVGGAQVSATPIVTGKRDPHHIDAKPSFMSRVAKADLFVAVGLELEIGYEQAILAGSRNARVQHGKAGHLYPYEGIAILERPREAVSRAQGDVHPQGNPHYWLDPYNGRIIAKNIAERLGKLQPESADMFSRNAASFARALDERMFGSALVAKFGGDTLWAWERAGQLATNLKSKGAESQLGGWEARMAPHRGKPVVTHHKTYSYFLNRFNLRSIDELEPKPGIDPTPGHLASVIKNASTNKVKAVLYDPCKSDRPAKFVASRIGGTAVEVPASVGQDPAARDYLTLFDVLVARVAAALGG